jgi:vitamin-K-epoxide reductase (warfarin-sensitive)
MTRSRLLLAIALLAVAGVVLSSVSLVNHYKKSATEYCDLGENFNCDIVNRSPYAEVAHVPVAAIGIAGYVFLLVMSRMAGSKRAYARIMFVAAVAGLAFALYLTYIEAYVLEAWCILCLGSLAAISLITILSVVWLAASSRSCAAST